MKYCSKCGTQNDETASFCNGCGNNLTENIVNNTIDSQVQPENVINNQTVSVQEPINSTIQSNAISSQNNNTGSSNPNEKSVGLAILGFLIPLVGIILFFAMKKDKPGKAKSALKGALICIILSFILGLIMVLIPIIKGIGSSTNNTQNTSSNSNVNSSTNNNIKEDIIGYWANKDKTIIFTISKAESSISSGEYYMELLGEGNNVISNSVSFTNNTITNGNTTYKYSIVDGELLLSSNSYIKLYKITESEFKSLESKIINSTSTENSSTNSTSSNNNNSTSNSYTKEDIIGYWANKDKTIVFTISKAESSISSGEYYMELLGEGNYVTSNSISFTDKTITNGSTTYNYTITNEELLLNNGAEIKLYKVTESEFKSLEAKIISSISGSSSSY